jgi:NADPH:quinone reductase-like Zn-dependent oxidoreductase
MKAIVHESYGTPDVLRLEEVERPAVPDDGVLVHVRACSLNAGDWYAVTGIPYVARGMMGGLLKPKSRSVGVDFAGTVEAVGSAVPDFRPGDEVFGGRTGAWAEYVCVRHDRAVAGKPANVSFEQAAAVPVAAITALQGLRDHGQLRSGQKVLINGASGGVGTFAVQIAKAFGADVTGVCSTRNVEVVRALGADRVIDYTQEDFTRTGVRYDLLLDVAGSRSWAACRRVLEKNGTYVGVGAPKGNPWLGPLGHIAGVRLASVRASQRVILLFIAKLNRVDLEVLAQLIESGKVAPAIDRQYMLNELPEALRYLGAGHTQGKVVITV